MIKPIPKSDVVVRPFTTFKSWYLQNQTFDSVLLTEDGCPLFVNYTEDSGSNCGASSCFASSSLALEVQDVDTRVSVKEGQQLSGYFYPVGNAFYNSESNPTNRDGTYKRLVYNTTKNLFYNKFNNPLELFGIQDYDSGKEIRDITSDKIIVADISNGTYGERIQSGTVVISDNSSVDQQVTFRDDGYTNLIIDAGTLINVQQLGAEPEITGSSYYEAAHDRFGRSVAAWNGYTIVGCPLDNESFSNPKAGSAYLYKYDPNQNKYRYIKKFYSPYSQNGFATEVGFDNDNLLMTELGFFLELDGASGYSVNDNYGVAVDIDSNTLAIGSPSCDFCGDVSGSGQVYIYGKYKGGSDQWGILNILQGSCSIDKFGSAVSISNTKMAVGAPGANNGKGRVYIFRQEVYGGTIPTSSYFFKLVEENDSCSIIGAEATASSYITSQTAGFEFTSSDCNVAFSNTASIFSSSLTLPNDDMQTGFEPYFAIAAEKGTPNFVSGNLVWSLESIIETNTSEGTNFGSCLSLSGSFLAVGSSSPTGSVYMFESQSRGWIRTQRFDRDGIADTVSCSFCPNPPNNNYFNLYDPNTLVSDNSSGYFGYSVALKNNTLLIGVPQDVTFSPFSGSSTTYQVGSVYFYSRYTQPDIEIIDYDCGVPVTQSIPNCGWKLVNKIYESSSVSFANNNFGFAIASDEDRFVVGSLYGKDFVTSSYLNGVFSIEDYGLSSNGPFSTNALQGRAIVYQYNNDSESYFSYVKTINNQKMAGEVKKSFGYSVAIDNNHVIVGAPIFMYGEVAAQYIITEDTSSYISPDYSGSVSGSGSSAYVTEFDTLGYFQPFSYNSQTLTNFVSPSVSGSAFIYDLNDLTATHSAGNVFYKNGTIVVTNTGSVFQNTFEGSGGTGYSVSFKGTHTIYEHEILCSVGPGEFNVSTNPTAVVRGHILYDVNNDGNFDAVDLDAIMRYYMKFTIVGNYTVTQDDDGYMVESQNPEQWWGNQLLLTESDDVFLIEPYLGNDIQTDEQILANLDSQLYQNLLALDQAGNLDINGDGVSSIEDGRILLNYYAGVRDDSLVRGNITPNSTRTTTAQVVAFLDYVTGVNNGITILDTFYNFQESSSLDATGSYLAPYITTIGLYQEAELIAVAKLGQPIKNITGYPMNFVVRFDT